MIHSEITYQKFLEINVVESLKNQVFLTIYLQKHYSLKNVKFQVHV